MLCLLCSLSAFTQPRLEKQGDATRLIVDDKLFLMLAGEVNNSSGSNIGHMERTMKAWKESGFNSVLVSVSWEIVEPQEGSSGCKYNFV